MADNSAAGHPPAGQGRLAQLIAPEALDAGQPAQEAGQPGSADTGLRP